MSYPKLLIVAFSKPDRDKIEKNLSKSNFLYTQKIALDELDALENLKKKNFNLLIYYSDNGIPKAQRFLKKLAALNKENGAMVVVENDIDLNSKDIRRKEKIGFIHKKDLSNKKLPLLLKQIMAETKSPLSLKTNNALLEENKYKILFENTQGFICTHNMQGKILSINKAGAKILGYKANELIGENLADLLVPEKKERFTEYLKEIKQKKKVSGIMQFMGKDKESRYLVYTNVIHDEVGIDPYVIASSQDITDIFLLEKQMESANRISELNINRLHKTLIELDKAKKIAEESVRIKQEFLANMSHEIRTPMNAIIGFTSLLEKSNLSYEQNDYLSAIKTSGENLLVIINDILDFSKIDAGKMTVETARFDLDNCIRTCINQFLPRIKEKNLLLNTHLNFDRNLFVIGDQVRLNQVLSNLIGNAIKFTEVGEINISVNIKNETPKYLVFEFTVSDTGIGIPKDKLSSIFESFTQASSETTRKYGGTGLGLAIAKKLLELQNGSISLKSHLNVGTTFTFTIPYQKTSHENSNRTKEKWLPVNKIQNLNILLAEDNLLNQKLVIKLLEDANCSVDVAENGLEAIDKVKQNSYDLILMDIQMPQMDGLEASKIIRDQLHVNVPIIALTAHTMEHEKDKCIKAGMNGFLSKPFNFESLHKTIFEFTSIDTSQKSTNKINLSLLTNLADGNFDFIIKMLEIYLKQTPENLASLNQGIRTKQYSEIASVAHKMRSSVPYVGLTEAEKLLESIEYEAKEKIELKKLPAKIKVLCDICNESLHAVQQELERIKKSYISK